MKNYTKKSILKLKPSSTLVINEKSKELIYKGKKVYQFGFGQSPFPVPGKIVEELKKNGFIVIGLSGDGQLSISKFDEKVPIVVVVGAEDKGISLLTQKKCDYLLRIPLKGKTSSLNASVAASISLFHLTGK